MLRALGLKFEVVTSEIEEKQEPTTSISELVEHNALVKARDVSKKFASGLVIGADTVVVFEGKIYGKPTDLEDARRMLRTLAGRTHQVYSGVAVVRVEDGESRTAHAVTDVTFRCLSEEQIDRYLRMIDPLDKAGAYAIQGAGGIIIEKISGCYYNVVGLPLITLDKLLGSFGVQLL